MLRDAAIGLFLGVPTGLAVGQVLLRKPKEERSAWDARYNHFLLNAFHLIEYVDMRDKHALFGADSAWEVGCDVFRLLACMPALRDRAALRAFLLQDKDLLEDKDTLAPDTAPRALAQEWYIAKGAPPPPVKVLAHALANFSLNLHPKKELTSPKIPLLYAAGVVQRTLECMAYFLPLVEGYTEATYFQRCTRKEDPSTLLMWDAWTHYYYVTGMP